MTILYNKDLQDENDPRSGGVEQNGPEALPVLREGRTAKGVSG